MWETGCLPIARVRDFLFTLLPSVMLNFMCQLDWVMRCLLFWPNILGDSMSVFLLFFFLSFFFFFTSLEIIYYQGRGSYNKSSQSWYTSINFLQH